MKQEALGRIDFEYVMTGDRRRCWQSIARAVVREYEKRKGVCECGYPDAFAGPTARRMWKYCPECGKRIKVGGK